MIRLYYSLLFDLIFINIYKPFSSLTWYPVSEFKFFIFRVWSFLPEYLPWRSVVWDMYFYTRKHTLNYIEYGIWIVLEIFFLSTFYTVYSCFYGGEGCDGKLLGGLRKHVINPFIAYAILMLYFSWRDKEQNYRCLKR